MSTTDATLRLPGFDGFLFNFEGAGLAVDLVLEIALEHHVEPAATAVERHC